MGVRSEVGGFLRAELPSNAGSSKLSSHQMAVRGDVGGFLRAELSSNAGGKELRTNPALNQVGRDGALPSFFQREFETLASAIETGADRALRQSAKRTDTDAVMYLHSLEQKKETEQADKTAADQFIQAASLKPRRFRARYMSTQFDGPSARRDAEEAERNRWIFYALRNHQRYSHTDGKDVNRQTWAAASGWRQASLNPQVPCEGSPKVFDLARTQQGTELSHVVRPTVRVPSRETLRTVQQGSFEGDPPEFCLSRGNGRNPGTRAIDRISSLWSDLSRTPCVSSTRKALQTGAAHALPHVVFS